MKLHRIFYHKHMYVIEMKNDEFLLKDNATISFSDLERIKNKLSCNLKSAKCDTGVYLISKPNTFLFSFDNLEEFKQQVIDHPECFI